jgi:large repetitive protein
MCRKLLTACFIIFTFILVVPHTSFGQACTEPTLSSLSYQAICEGATFAPIGVNVTNSVNVTYQWYNDNGDANPTTNALAGQTSATLTALPTAIGIYRYKIVATNTADAACKAEKTVTLVIAPLIPARDLCNGASYTATVQSGLTNIQWFVDRGTGYSAIAGATNTTLNIISAGKYKYTAQDASGCVIDLCCPIEITPCSACHDDVIKVPEIVMIGKCTDDSLSVCLPIRFEESYNYNIFNGLQLYAAQRDACDFDTLFQYNYFVLPGQGTSAPYRLDYWNANGKTFTAANITSMQQLVDSMNGWDPLGQWRLDIPNLSIVGGLKTNAYQDMRFTTIRTGAISIMRLNTNIVAKGTRLKFKVQNTPHTVVFENINTGCKDTVIIKVLPDPNNSPPLAIWDGVSTLENATIAISVLINDSDTDGDIDTSSLAITTLPKNGRATVGANGIINYTPNTGFAGKDSLIYTICDKCKPAACDTAIVYIMVNSVNRAPIANVDIEKTPINTPLSISVKNNDIDDTDLNSATITITTQAKNGTATVLPNGQIRYVPNTSYTGKDSLIYNLCDNGTPPLCDTAMVYITIEPCKEDIVPIDTLKVIEKNDSIFVCLPLRYEEGFNYDFYNGLALLNTTREACDFDTLYQYNYFVLPNQGAGGPYRLDYWTVNGKTYTANSIATMQQLTDSMNVWDAAGQWRLDIPNQSIVGGLKTNDYRDMRFTTIRTGAISIIRLNTNIVARGIGMRYKTVEAPPAIIVINKTTGCRDSVHIKPKKVQTPVANVDIVTTPKNTPLSIVVKNNDIDGIDLNAATVTITNSPKNGTALVLPNGSIRYTPNPTFTGKDSLIYNLCNTEIPPSCDTALVIITIDDCKENIISKDMLFAKAICKEDSIEVCLDVPYVSIGNYKVFDGSVLLNGAKFDGCDYDTAFQYNYFVLPGRGASGPYHLDYWTINGRTYSAPSLATMAQLVDSMRIWDPAGLWQLDENQLSIVGGLKTQNYGDMRLTSIRTVAYSIIRLNLSISARGTKMKLDKKDRVMTLENINTGCNDQVVIKVLDEGCTYPPIAVNDTVSTDNETPITETVARNDTDADTPKEDLTFTLIGNVPNTEGVLVLYPEGIYTFTPNPNFVGTVNIAYKVCDKQGLCDTAYIKINVSKLPCANLIADKLVYSANCMNDSADVCLDIARDSIFKYKLFIDGKGYNSITEGCKYDTAFNYSYFIVQGKGFSGDYKVEWTVNGVTHLIPMVKDVKSLADSLNKIDIGGNWTINVAKYILVGGVKTSIYGPMKFTQLRTRATATLRLNSTFIPRGTLIRMPAGVHTLSFDKNGCLDTTQVTVSCINADIVMANRNDVQVDEDNPLTINVLNNDTRSNGNPINPNTVTISDTPKNGIATVNPDGTIQYTPNPNFFGKDTLIYKICNTVDISAQCDTALVVITVNPVNDAPIANRNDVITLKNTPKRIEILNNDVDIEDTIDPQSVTITENPKNGTAIVNPDGTIGYTPKPNFIGRDTLIYRVCDKGTPVQCDTALVVILVKPNTQPEYKLVEVKMGKRDTICLETSELLGKNHTINTCGNAGDVVNFTPISNSICIQMEAKHVGRDSICYEVCDEFGVCDTTYIYAYVTFIGQKVADDSTITPINTPITINIIENDNIANGAGSNSVLIVNNPNHGTVTVLPNGRVKYEPQKDWCSSKPDSMRYVLCNSVIGCDTAWVRVTILCDDIRIYNGFSPNGDGLNDFFTIEGLEKYPNNRLCIYNRWGTQVMETKAYKNDWDGVWNNQRLPDGTYFYVFDRGDGKPVYGYVQLHR